MILKGDHRTEGAIVRFKCSATAQEVDRGAITALELVTEWRTEAAFVGRGHYKAADRAARLYRTMAIITAAVSAGVGAALLLMLQGTPGADVVKQPVPSILAVISLLAGALMAVQAVLGFEESSQQHRGAGAAYEVLGRELDVFVVEEHSHPDMKQLKAIRQRLNELDKTTPLIPRKAYCAARREIVNCEGHLAGRGRPRGVLVHDQQAHDNHAASQSREVTD